MRFTSLHNFQYKFVHVFCSITSHVSLYIEFINFSILYRRHIFLHFLCGQQPRLSRWIIIICLYHYCCFKIIDNSAVVKDTHKIKTHTHTNTLETTQSVYELVTLFIRCKSVDGWSRTNGLMRRIFHQARTSRRIHTYDVCRGETHTRAFGRKCVCVCVCVFVRKGKRAHERQEWSKHIFVKFEKNRERARTTKVFPRSHWENHHLFCVVSICVYVDVDVLYNQFHQPCERITVRVSNMFIRTDQK